MTPVYADTVRSTGIVPEGDPSATEIPVGTTVVEMPSLTPGVIFQGSPVRVPLPRRTTSLYPPASLELAVPRPAPVRKR